MSSEGTFPNDKVRGALRTAWTMSKSYQGFKKSKRIERERLKKDGTPHKRPSVLYKCADCGIESKEGEQIGVNKRGNPKRKLLIYIDHVIPAVCPREGFKDWFTFWERLYVAPEDWDEKLQILCRECHQLKTKEERALRVEYGTLTKNGRNRPETTGEAD